MEAMVSFGWRLGGLEMNHVWLYGYWNMSSAYEAGREAFAYVFTGRIVSRR